MVRKLAGLTFKANFLWAVAGNMIYAAAQWAMLVSLAKLGRPDMLGVFGLGLAITAPIFMLANLQLRAVQATDANCEYRFQEYLGLVLVTSLLGLAATALLAGTGRYSGEVRLVILLFGLAKAAEATSDVMYGLLQQHERMDWVARCTTIRGVGALIVLTLAVALTGRLVYGVLGLALTWILSLLFIDTRFAAFLLGDGLNHPARIRLRFGGEFTPRWNAGTLELARRTLPLGCVAMLFSLNVNVPRYFIEHYFGERDLGLFTPLAYMVVAGNTLAIALGQAASPRLASHYANRDVAGFRTLLGKLASASGLVGVFGVAVAALFGAEILTLLYRSEYAAQSAVFVVLMAGAAASYVASVLNCGMIAARYFKAQMWVGAATVAVATAACAILIPHHGLMGAGIAQLIGYVFQVGVSVAVIVAAMRRAQAGQSAGAQIAVAAEGCRPAGQDHLTGEEIRIGSGF